MEKALANQDFYYHSAEESHFWIISRMSRFIHLLGSQKISLTDKRGLEVGCGNCLVSYSLERQANCSMDCVDLREAIQSYPVKGRRFIYDISERSSEFENKYDFVVLFDVLEHIEKPEDFLEDLAFHLKPGGHLFVNVPSLQWLFSRYDEIAGHLRRYTKESLATEAEKSRNYRIVAASYWGLTFIPLVFLRKILLHFSSDKSEQEAYSLGFQPPNPFIGAALRFLAWAEGKVLPMPPIGSSLLAVLQKHH